jgi:hypothetical protein
MVFGVIDEMVATMVLWIRSLWPHPTSPTFDLASPKG